MFRKLFITCLVALSLVSSSLSPLFARKAEAQWAVFDVPQTARMLADMVGRRVAQVVIQRMVNSTVNWASSGFQGNPAYVTNPRRFFQDIADGVAGEFIMGSDLGFLCSPFQLQIRMALRRQYLQDERFQCTLSGVIGNIEGFYGDFSQGGWDGWFTMTQNNSNNPYGAYLDAQIEMDRRIANAIGLQQQQLDWNQGFLSWSSCVRNNPPPTINDEMGLPIPNPDHVPGTAVGECVERGPTQTPGSVIAAQLNNVLPANMNRYINAQHVEDLVEAFISGSLNRFVFGSQGLFGGGGGAAVPQQPFPDPGAGVQGTNPEDGLNDVLDRLEDIRDAL